MRATFTLEPPIAVIDPWYVGDVRRAWIAAAVLVLGTTASGQFTPEFNHLFCYGIHELPGESFTPVAVDVETQLGVEQQVTVMRPAILCAPAKKTGGGVDPLPATAVPHFTCYRPRRGDARGVAVQLTDQFGTGTYTITSRRLLCAPAVKELGSPSGAFLR
jgi:hypothetical protein